MSDFEQSVDLFAKRKGNISYAYVLTCNNCAT